MRTEESRWLIRRRNADLMAAYKEVMRLHWDEPRADIIRRLLACPAGGFYVLPEQAMRLVSYYESHGRFPVKKGTSTEKYAEIMRRFKAHPDLGKRQKIDIMNEIVSQPAPAFYLTEKSCAVTVTRLLREGFR